MNLRSRAAVSFTATFELSEPEARALFAMSQYEARASREALSKCLTSEISRVVTERDWEAFITSIREQLAPALSTVDEARRTLAGHGVEARQIQELARVLGVVSGKEVPGAVRQLQSSIEGLHCEIPKAKPARRKRRTSKRSRPKGRP